MAEINSPSLRPEVRSSKCRTMLAMWRMHAQVQTPRSHVTTFQVLCNCLNSHETGGCFRRIFRLDPFADRAGIDIDFTGNGCDGLPVLYSRCNHAFYSYRPGSALTFPWNLNSPDLVDLLAVRRCWIIQCHVENLLLSS